MKAIILVLLAPTGVANASRPREAGEPMPHSWEVGMRTDVGDSDDSSELSLRYEVGEATTGFVQAYALEAVGGTLGDGHAGFGATGWLAPMGVGLSAKLHAIVARGDTMTGDKEWVPIARGSIGLRFGWIEAGYSYQLPITGEREQWLAKHSAYVGIILPFSAFDL